ncbi:MAG: amidohydrolase family protein [Cyclobacteriaceae bacterium]|nr:amidohydrolase family protein [Cyclobacteriaceae bacterium]
MIRYACSLLLFCVVFPACAQRTLLHCGHIYDVKAGRLLSERTIVVQGDSIASVERGYLPPTSGDSLIDLKNLTVLPGLIDMHVHLEGETREDEELDMFTLNPEDVAFRSVVFAKRTLYAGFTTVRDLGGSGVNTALRNAINQGLIEGPRIFSAGKSIATTGGHADPTNAFRRDLMGDPGPAEGVINGPDEARKAVRQRYKDGVDLIKITATGGVLSLAKDGSGPQFTDAELQAIVETARDYGMHVAAHAHGAEGMRRAVRAGITTIEHGTMMTDDIMDLMIQKGTYYVPTISAGQFVADKAKEEGYFHPLVVPKALEVGPQIQRTFAKAYKRGVKIAFGTDSGVGPHGQNAREFGYMVDAGMPPSEAIRSATVTNAAILGMADELGALEPGKYADIIAVSGNPLENIRVLEHVVFVMKNGVVYKR